MSSIDQRPTEELRADRKRYLSALAHAVRNRRALDAETLRRLIKRIDAVLAHR
jgi:hypothetical protein